MKFFGQFIKVLLILTAGLTLGCYAFFLFVLPNILTSPENVQKYENLLGEKIGVPVSIKGLEVKTSPNLSFEVKSDNIFIVPQNNTELFHLDKIKYGANLFRLKHGHLSADYIYTDLSAMKKYLKLAPSKDKKSFDLSFFPVTNIKGAQIKFNDKNYLDVDYIRSKKHKGKIVTRLLANIYSEYSKAPVTIGENGYITYKDYVGLEQFSVKLPKSEILLTGSQKGLKIAGKNLPAKELEEGFLYFYKLKHPNKRNFLENFSDFKGTMDADLFFDKRGLTGKVVTHNLGAKFSKIKVDVFLPETVFDFQGREVGAKTSGTFGTEPVATDFHLTGMMTDDLHVMGNVSSVFQDRLTKKYFPAVGISGKIPANVKYHTHNQNVNVYYTLKLNKGTNILSEWGNLDNVDKTRLLTMHTVKSGDPMKIESWEYSADGVKILSGSGNFEKINGRYTLADMNVKTNGKISVNYIKSFLRDYVKSGEFDADLRLDFLKDVLLGSVNLYNASHRDFLYLKKANINITPQEIGLKTIGSFYSAPIKMSARVANRVSDDILIHSIDIYMKEFHVRKGKIADMNESFKDGKPKHKPNPNKKKIKYTVEQGRVVVDRIYADSFDIYNANIQGSLKNNVATFIIPKADYASGLLSAKGTYNLGDHSSNIWFYASDIDSNVVLTRFFHLPNHVKGTAYATLHAISKNKFNDIKANATFAISDGYMPRIAEQEIFFGEKRPDGTQKGVKYTISKIINLDFSKPEDYMANIYGSFNLDNDNLRDLRMFLKSEGLSLYFEGMYDIPTECGNLSVWGKRNKTLAKGIRIFKIPVNLLYRIIFEPEHSYGKYEDKIKLIPSIDEKITDETSVFRVKVMGYFNRKGGLKYELKDLRK